MRALRFRWPVVVVLAGATGCLPITGSGLPEFCAIVVVPGLLGFLITRWWSEAYTRLGLSVVLPFLGSAMRLASSLLHDRTNWFGRLSLAIGAGGVGNPYVRQILLMLLFPVAVTIVATVMHMTFQRRTHSKDF